MHTWLHMAKHAALWSNSFASRPRQSTRSFKSVPSLSVTSWLSTIGYRLQPPPPFVLHPQGHHHALVRDHCVRPAQARRASHDHGRRRAAGAAPDAARPHPLPGEGPAPGSVCSVPSGRLCPCALADWEQQCTWCSLQEWWDSAQCQRWCNAKSGAMSRMVHFSLTGRLGPGTSNISRTARTAQRSMSGYLGRGRSHLGVGLALTAPGVTAGLGSPRLG